MSDKRHFDLTDEEIEVLPVSRQRKWQLRNPDKERATKRLWLQSESGKASKRASNKRWRDKQREQV